MFESLRLIGPPERKIVLQTHKGRNIENSIAFPPSEQDVVKYKAICKKHSNWIERKPPAGVCNCVGQVWANRRTGVFENLDAQVGMIRDDDGYRTVGPAELLQPGDLVTYWESVLPYRGFLHVGLVVHIAGVSGSTSPAGQVPIILSKWDSASGEVLHHVPDVPFAEVFEGFITEFWTDRPETSPRPKK